MSKIVRVAGEKLKTMPSQTDWKKVAAMTDEEVESAVASDPDEAGLDDWIEQAIVTDSFGKASAQPET